MDIQIKRIYDAPDATDGFRILVDRVWPRGVSREKAALKEWDKMIAPSSELRKWFGHDPSNTKNSGSDIGKNWKIIRKRSRL